MIARVRITEAGPRRGNKRQNTRIPIDELLNYWIDISKCSNLTVDDYALFFDRTRESMNHFAEFYGWRRPVDVRLFKDKFYSRIESLLWLRNDLLKAAEGSKQLPRNDYAEMKDVAKNSFLASRSVLARTSLRLSVRKLHCKTRKQYSLRHLSSRTDGPPV